MQPNFNLQVRSYFWSLIQPSTNVDIGTPLETDPYLMPRYYSEKLSSSGTKSPITTHLKTSLKHPNSPSCEDENLQSVKMLSEMLQKNQALKTPIKACYPSTNERANTEPSEYNFRISSQYQSTKPHYESSNIFF